METFATGAGYNERDLVFALADGSPVRPSIFGVAVRDLAARAGFDISLHCLRDTHASLLGKADVPLEVISRRPGHSSIAITAARYLHVYKNRDADAATAFERLVA